MSEIVADVVLTDGNKVLLVQQRKESAYGLWSFPGGHIEKGETLEEGLVREVMEELGLRLTNAKFFKTYSITTPLGPLDINTFTGGMTGQIRLKDDELMAYGWFTLESLETMRDKLRAPVVLEQSRDVLAIKGT